MKPLLALAWSLSAYLRIAETPQVFVLTRFHSENRFTLFRQAL